MTIATVILLSMIIAVSMAHGTVGLSQKGSQSPTPTVLIMVNQDLYSQIKDRLTVFQGDLREQGYSVVISLVSGETRPDEVRAILQEQFAKSNLKGAVLIGNIKAAYAEIITGDYSNPEALKLFLSLDAADHYYMDLDGQWDATTDPNLACSLEDKPSNVAEVTKYPSCDTFKNEYIVYPESRHMKWNYSAIQNKSQFQAEIWVSRIMAHNLAIPGKTEAQIINEYLDWNHQFRVGTPRVASKAYVLNSIGVNSTDFNDQGMNYTAIFDVVVKQATVKKSTYIGYLSDPVGSRLLYLTAHSSPQGHALNDTTFGVTDLAETNKTSLFYLMNACSACRWDQYLSTPSNPNYLCGLYVFDRTQNVTDYGLSAIGFTGVGGFNNLHYLTDYLRTNTIAQSNDTSLASYSYGEAYRYWFNENLMLVFGPTNYVYLGDPTLMPNPLLNTLSVVPVTPPSPPDAGTVTASSATFRVHVMTIQNETVQNAGVTVYVDDGQVCSGLSDSNGYYSCTHTVAQIGRTYSWYAIAERPGYNPMRSLTWTFTYATSQGPSLNLSTPQINGLAVTVNGTTSAGTPGTTIIRINWTWGDGTSGDAWLPATHTYSQAGAYTINATAFQSDGLSTTKTTSLTVQNTLSVSLVSPPSPADGVTVSSSPLALQARVTSGGSPVQSGAVKVYVDGSQVCSGGSDSSGTYSCSYSPSGGGHSWYATASKPGYTPGTSLTWTFTYQPPRCVIATAAYGSEMAPEVVYMRYVRDNLIGSTPTGRILRDGWNAFYYLWSPSIAYAIADSELLRGAFRVLLLPLVVIIHVTGATFTALSWAADLASIVAFALAAALLIATYIAAPFFLLHAVMRRRSKAKAAEGLPCGLAPSTIELIPNFFRSSTQPSARPKALSSRKGRAPMSQEQHANSRRNCGDAS